MFYSLLRDWASSSVIWPPPRTLLIPSDGWKWIKNNNKLSAFFLKNGKNISRRRKATWWERAAEDDEWSGGGVSDQESRSAVEVWGFLTGVLLSIFLSNCFFFWKKKLFSSDLSFWAMSLYHLNISTNIFVIFV